MTTVHYYDPTCTQIVRTRSYATRALAWAAIQRAARRGQVAGYAARRTAQDAPTVHH